jgi:hypothetical protein
MAKRICKQQSKVFVPLRSSGVSSFVNGLREIAINKETSEAGEASLRAS